jgi:signal peptidase I
MPSPKIWVAAFIAAGLLLWLNDRFLFESVHIPSSSMRPTVLPDECAWLQKCFVGKIRRFDVVVIYSPSLKVRIVKRVIGLPGDRVKLADSWKVSINGKTLDYQPVAGFTNRLIEAGTHEIQLQRNPKFFFDTKYGRKEFKLGPDEYYVLGDNRLASEDSRTFGPVKGEDIQGRLRLIWYSYDLKKGDVRWPRLGKEIE